MYELIAGGFPKWKSLQSIIFITSGKIPSELPVTNHIRTGGNRLIKQNMTSKKPIIFAFTALLFVISCEEFKKQKTDDVANRTVDFEQEKTAILETLNNETKAAFQRDYESWKEKWVHDPTITKTYINFADSSFSESVGWDEISNFVKTFIEEHPEPEPIPTLVDDVDVRLYGNGAWVIYEQQDSLRGLKRETRLMEKVNGQWKIAGMHTTIYGLKKEE